MPAYCAWPTTPPPWPGVVVIHDFTGMSRDIVSFGFVEKVTADAGRVDIVLQMTTHNEEAVVRARDEVERAAAGVSGRSASQGR